MLYSLSAIIPTMQALPYSETVDDYGGVPLGIEALLSIPLAHSMPAEFPFEWRSRDAHDAAHGNTLEALP